MLRSKSLVLQHRNFVAGKYRCKTGCSLRNAPFGGQWRRHIRRDLLWHVWLEASYASSAVTANSFMVGWSASMLRICLRATLSALGPCLLYAYEATEFTGCSAYSSTAWMICSVAGDTLWTTCLKTLELAYAAALGVTDGMAVVCSTVRR